MQLASVLDLAAARPLWSQLCARRRQQIEIDASAVDRLGGQCLQLLLAAKQAWAVDGVPFSVVHPSQAFTDALRLSGANELVAEAGRE